MKIVGRRVANAKGELNMLDDGLLHDTFESYPNLRHNVDQTLLAVGILLEDLINR